MGIKIILTCDGKDCNATETFGNTTSLRDLHLGGWRIEPGIGGPSGVYCPECQNKRFKSSVSEIFKEKLKGNPFQPEDPLTTFPLL